MVGGSVVLIKPFKNCGVFCKLFFYIQNNIPQFGARIVILYLFFLA